MLLLKLLSPKKIPRGSSNKFWYRCYRMLLRCYLRRYAKVVINDRIVVDGVEVRHTMRDKWFENELRRFGFEFKPAFNTLQQESLRTIKHFRYRSFNWEDKVTITRKPNVGKQKLKVDGPVGAPKTPPPPSSPETPKGPATPPKKKKIHIKDQPQQEPPQTERPLEQPTEPQDQGSFVQHIGFEENDIF